MVKDKKKVLIASLVIIGLLLAGTLIFIFVISPALNGLVVRGYNEGVQVAILTIAQQAAQCKTVPLTVGNATINLVAIECPAQNSAVTK